MCATVCECVKATTGCVTNNELVLSLLLPACLWKPDETVYAAKDPSWLYESTVNSVTPQPGQTNGQLRLSGEIMIQEAGEEDEI